MSELQKQRAGRGRVRPPEDTAGKHKTAARQGASASEGGLGECPRHVVPGVRRWWRKCERDWPQLNRRDRQHLVEYCRLRVEIERVEKTLRKEGSVITIRHADGSVAAIKAHPLLSHVRALTSRADRMVRDFAGTAGTRERARPVQPQGTAAAAPVLTLLQKGKPE